MEPTLSNIRCIKGEKTGPRVVVMGAVHGNERLGEAVVESLLNEIRPQDLHGELILITGNPLAYAGNKRFINTDLNRLFGPEIEILSKKPIDTLNIEEKRALEIAPFLQKADYLLDIHCTIKPSVPFVYCESTKAHLELAHLFETEYVVSPGENCRIPDLFSSSDNYVDKHGGKGITYEAGWHKEPALFSEVVAKTHRFLHAVGSFSSLSGLEKFKKMPKEVMINDYLIPQSPNFHFNKDFSNFDVVKKGEVIAEDEGRLFTAEKDSLIVFPKIDIIPGKPACYLASY